MITYNSECYDRVRDSVELPPNLEWLAERGYLHISTAREKDELKGYILSVFSNTTPLEADFIEAKGADTELWAKDKLYLQWHGVTKIVRGDKTIWTN